MEKLNGWKTHIIALLMVLYNVLGMVLGMGGPEAATWIDPGAAGAVGPDGVLMGLGLSSLRSGVAKLKE